jgi:hypothetical protein
MNYSVDTNIFLKILLNQAKQRMKIRTVQPRRRRVAFFHLHSHQYVLN